jgi:hypothetical protein
MSTQLALQGSQILLYINASVFGIASSFMYSIDYESVSIHGIDLMGPVEVTPERFKISGKAEVWRLLLDNGLEGWNVTVPVEQLSLAKYISIVALERTSDTLIFSSSNCTIKSQNWEIKSRSLIKGSFEFEALDCVLGSTSGVNLAQ